MKGENGLVGSKYRHNQERRRKIMGHGENKSAVSAQGEHRMREGQNKM